jgi:hypothetical protein
VLNPDGFQPLEDVKEKVVIVSEFLFFYGLHNLPYEHAIEIDNIKADMPCIIFSTKAQIDDYIAKVERMEY